MKLKKVKVLVTQSCLTFCNPMNCNLPGFSVHGILLARILERVAILFSRGVPHPGIESMSPACRQIFYHLCHQGSPLYSSSIEKYKVVYFTLFIRMKDQMDQILKCKIKSNILGKKTSEFLHRCEV